MRLDHLLSKEYQVVDKERYHAPLRQGTTYIYREGVLNKASGWSEIPEPVRIVDKASC